MSIIDYKNNPGGVKKGVTTTMDDQTHNHTVFGVLAGTVLGGTVALILFGLTGKAMFVLAVAIGTGLGFVIGFSKDRAIRQEINKDPAGQVVRE